MLTVRKNQQWALWEALEVVSNLALQELRPPSLKPLFGKRQLTPMMRSAEETSRAASTRGLGSPSPLLDLRNPGESSFFHVCMVCFTVGFGN